MGHHSSKYHKYHSGSYTPPSWRDEPKPSRTFQSGVTLSSSKHDLSRLAVISVIFNPIKYRSRYEHYHNFARHMSQSGVHLITVECIFESTPEFGLPKQTFEITRPENPYHVQIRAPSILWMKENLINVVAKQLPPSIEYIAWIDADIEFERLDWPQLAITELQRYPIVQLFELSYFLGPRGKKEILRRDYSFGYSIRNNKPIDPQRYKEWYAHPGYAWAMRRTEFDAIGGLLDFCIVGSGDLHFAFALLNRIEETIKPGLHPDYQQLAIQWAQTVSLISQSGENVGYIPVNIFHFWHGERNDRSYVDRWGILVKHQYSPLNDLEKNEENGLIRLVDRNHLNDSHEIKRIEALERDIVLYFKSRDEDSNRKVMSTEAPKPATRPPIRPYQAPKTQPNRPGPSARMPRAPISSGSSYHYRPGTWSSGPSGTHVDYNPYDDHCMCPGHVHIHGNHDCPYSAYICDNMAIPHHIDHHPGDEHCHDDDHHHHHHHHHSGNEACHNDDHQYPDNYCVDPHDHDHDHSGGNDFNYATEDYGNTGTDFNPDSDYGNTDFTSGGGVDYTDYSSGGGYDSTDYGGAGSFY